MLNLLHYIFCILNLFHWYLISNLCGNNEGILWWQLTEKAQKVHYVRKNILLKYGFQDLSKVFIAFHMGRDFLDYTILPQLF